MNPRKSDLETAVEILRRYNSIVQRDRKENPFRFINGCKERSMRMRSEFSKKGMTGVDILYIVSNLWLTHESNAMWHYHFVPSWQNLVFDPHYTERKPIPLEEYAATVFLEGSNPRYWGLKMYRVPDISNPLWPNLN
jgi:hypothetical protein